MEIHILPPNQNAPAGKLAEAEVHLSEGLLSGLKLVGFGVWEGRDGRGRNVSFPARTYSVDGERRNYALLRGVEHTANAEPLRQRILQAYAEHEERIARATAS